MVIIGDGDLLISFGCEELDLSTSLDRLSPATSICPGENLNSGKRNGTKNVEENW
jgi:hypothetical protein